MPFQYNVFLSYARGDREWAQRVHSTLRNLYPAYSFFFDFDSLRAGDDWEAVIEAALENSQSLIVLWSDHAKDSPWVSFELISFRQAAKPKVNPDRRLIVLNLQGANVSVNSLQPITDSDLQNSYLKGEPLPADLWQRVSARISDGLNPKKPLIVPLVVLTLTLDEFNGLTAKQLAGIQNDLSLSPAFLKARYGATRAEWKPFAGAQTIGAFLQKMQDAVNTSLTAHRLSWRFPGDEFWSADINSAKHFVRNEFDAAELAVLIIDPVAVYHQDVFQRLMLFQECLGNDRRVIVTLPPFGVPRKLRRLREILSNRATPYFDDYFQPTVPPRRRLAAQCAWTIADADDMKRYILAAAGGLGAPPGNGAPATFIRHG